MKLSAKTSGVSLHFEKHKANDASINGLQRHNERTEGSGRHSNKNIKPDRTADNVVLKQSDGTYQRQVEAIIEQNRDKGLKGVRKDAVRMVEATVQLSGQVLDRSEDEQERVLRDSYDWLKQTFGEQNIVSATIHKDETNMHLHFDFVPITHDGRLSANDVLSKKTLIQYQNDFLAHLKAGHRTLNFERGSSEYNGLPQEVFEKLQDERKDMLSEVEERESELDAGLDKLEAGQKKLVYDQERLSEGIKALGDRETALKAREQSVTARETDLKAKGREVHAKEVKLLKSQNTLSESIKALDKREQELDSRETALKAREQSVTVREKASNKKDREQTAKEKKLLKLQNTLSEGQDELKAMRDEVLKEQDRLKVLKDEVRKEQDRLEKLRKGAGDRFRECADAFEKGWLKREELQKTLDEHKPINECFESLASAMDRLASEAGTNEGVTL